MVEPAAALADRGAILCEGRSPSRVALDQPAIGERCRRAPRMLATTRGTFPPRLAGFAVLYEHVGYCRRSDGSDPPYQRPFSIDRER